MKLELLRRADAVARAADSRVIQVMCSLAGSYETILVAGSDGTWSADVRPLVRMDVSVIIEHQGRREQAPAGGGGRARYADVFDGDLPERYAREEVRMAVMRPDRGPAPPGPVPR